MSVRSRWLRPVTFGEKIPGPFKPLNLTGPEAGKYSCLYCKYGQRPVAMVFVREITPAVARLLATIDAELSATQAQELQRRLPGLTGGEGVVDSSFAGYRPVSGEQPGTAARPSRMSRLG